MRDGGGGSVVVFRSVARFTLVIVVVFALNAIAGSAVASSTKVDFGDISHKGLKNLGPASAGTGTWFVSTALLGLVAALGGRTFVAGRAERAERISV